MATVIIWTIDSLSLSRLEVHVRRVENGLSRILIISYSVLDIFILIVILIIHQWIDIYIQILNALCLGS